MKFTNKVKGFALAVAGALIGTTVIVVSGEYPFGMILTFVIATYGGILSSIKDKDDEE
jgi:hypothetical protein